MIDIALRRLAQAPVPPELATMEQRVLASIADELAYARSGIRGRVGAFAAVGALVVGIAVGALPGSGANATPSLSPLDSTSALAPSTLLLRGQ